MISYQGVMPGNGCVSVLPPVWIVNTGSMNWTEFNIAVWPSSHSTSPTGSVMVSVVSSNDWRPGSIVIGSLLTVDWKLCGLDNSPVSSSSHIASTLTLEVKTAVPPLPVTVPEAVIDAEVVNPRSSNGSFSFKEGSPANLIDWVCGVSAGGGFGVSSSAVSMDRPMGTPALPGCCSAVREIVSSANSSTLSSFPFCSWFRFTVAVTVASWLISSSASPFWSSLTLPSKTSDTRPPARS